MGLRTWLGLKKPKDYWGVRKDYVYYQHVRDLAAGIAADAQSILDVGSNGCPQLDWFTAPHRVSVDISNPYRGDGVEAITADFLAYAPEKPFDLCLCLQVLEHIPDAGAFAQKLLLTGRHVIASVPYKWPKGSCKQHVHDPVDEAKMAAWFGRDPDHMIVAQEAAGGRKSRRLICHYHSPYLPLM
jgi:hypothetical protein